MQKIKKLQNGLINYFSKLSGLQSKKTDENNKIKNKKISTETNGDKVTSDDVAIIGISGRFPKSPELESFWDNIVNGRDMISEIPKDRWDWRECFGDPHKNENKTDSKWGGFLDDVKSFDAGFFRISPKEAELMDPQQRLLMEEVWKVIEDAGYSPSSLSGTKTGVFIGASNNDYDELLRREDIRQDVHAATSSYFCIIPNRISYFLNLHGPSVAVDTACSASLVAIHQAVQAIRTGDCTMAIAGGVNLCLTPRKYFSFSHAGMLSPDGRCKTFDKRANGYVRAEGAGVILLKPLEKAIADGDPIYGKIIGTAQNHNGYGGFEHAMTASNPEAQAELLISAYEEADIPPNTVTFIEAHGSATALGDPFEITGLKKAFSTLYTKWGIPVPEKPLCGIGSVKSNMGHAEPAAGIAGVLKVLLALKYKTIPANLHLDELNPIIRLKKSPFYMVTETAEWKQLQNEKGQSIPRRTGVSSFGFGGANAHVVIEEYIEGRGHRAEGVESRGEGRGARGEGIGHGAESVGHRDGSKERKNDGPYLIVLSAKNENRLKAYAEKFLDYVKTALNVEPSAFSLQASALSLSEIAYTLQVGRDAMEERLGIIVGSMEALGEKLKGFLSGESVVDLHRGQVKQSKETLAVFADDEDMERIIDSWITKGKYGKLLDLWVKGQRFDWNRLYGDVKPRRISLPTYPFAGERYWVPEGRGQRAESIEHRAGGGVRVIHPLLHENTSDLFEQRFSSTFTGEEFFLADHLVKGERVLPAVAYIEMARAAVEKAAGISVDTQTGMILKKMIWLSPCVVKKHPVQLHIGLFPQEGGEITYEIYSVSEDIHAERNLHSRGVALPGSAPDVSVLDIEAIKPECDQAILSSDECYDMFKAKGIHYGPGHRGIEKIYAGSGQVLAKLSLPPSILDTQDHFVLHPSLVDSALQASIGLVQFGGDTENAAELKPAMPFALEALEIFCSCTQNMWVSVREIGGGTVQKFDIDLCDETGKICVRMKGFSSRVLDGDLKAGQAAGDMCPPDVVEPYGGATLLMPVWDSIPVDREPRFPSSQHRVVIVGGTCRQKNAIQKYHAKASLLNLEADDTIETITNRLETIGSIDHIIWIAPENVLTSPVDDAAIKEQARGVIRCFRMIKALLGLGYGGLDIGWSIVTMQTQSVYPGDPVDPTHASLHGLIGSMAREYLHWKIRIVDLGADCNLPIDEIFTLPADFPGNPLVYRNGQWHRQQLIPVHCPPYPVDQTLYRQEGVYVVIGGAGGIGEAWSGYMIRTYGARIIWIGRREKDASIKAKLESMAEFGPAPLYISADATDEKALAKAYDQIKRKYSHINGVIHSAIVLSDQSLANMNEERFLTGLSAKVDVSVRMTQVFQNEPLDFILFFSSMTAFAKTPGQSNYAAGCNFKDAFAHRLSQEWPCAVKTMNWGYWGSVGIAASKDYQDRMTRAGIGSIEPPEAMKVLETLLVGPFSQLGFVKTKGSLTMEGINPEELITCYPGNSSSMGPKSSEHNPPLGFLMEASRGVSAKQTRPLFPAVNEEMDVLFGKLLWGQLQSMGLFVEKHPVIAELKSKIRNLYDRWFDETIVFLSDRNYLQYDGTSYSVNEPNRMEMNALWETWHRKKVLWLEDPGKKAQVVLTEATLGALPEILTGKTPATDIMFPDSSMELVEGVYKGNPVANYFNETFSDIVVAYINERTQQDPSVRIRILEIGAGTGGLSAAVFSKLEPFQDRIQEYCYTDISKAFLMHAEREYGAQNPFLTYKILNIEMPIAEQNVLTGVYDLVIASNVLHATSSIQQTLRNAKSVLKRHGVLLLNELSGNSLFAHLTFGLLKGWWLYEDPWLRIPGCPGLSPESWQDVLEREGFGSVFFPTQEAHKLGQQIVVAASDGVVRQKQPQQPEKLPAKRSVSTKVHRSPGGRVAVTDKMAADRVKETIIETLSASLKVDVDVICSDESFADYGLDSITGVQMVQVVNEALGIELENTSLFDYSSVNLLTAHIVTKYKDIIDSASGQNKNHNDTTHDATTDSGQVPPVYSYPKRFYKRRIFLETGSGKREENTGDSPQQGAIAIIGMSGRFAKSETVDELWEHLSNGEDLVEKVSRWDLSEYYSDSPGNSVGSCNHGGFLDDIDGFDPFFFNISGLEATYMDPQQRFFLEESWKALEDAGYAGTGIEGRMCGVYVGCGVADYQHLFEDNPPAQAFWGNAGSVIPARIAYYLNLQGPAVAVDTACSSSLTAIHLACQGLWTGEIELALAGGVFIQSTPEFYISANRAGMLSPTGRCHTFDGRADGFVPGEGVGVVVLKRLNEAISDGDHICGVIRGSGINQDGKTNGITAPSAVSQERLERRVYDTFDIHPEQIQMVEAHGTGTKLGDPIEFEALTRAYREDTEKKEYCALGSIKTNIGHAATAAGVAGIIKILLSLEHKQIPPSLHFESSNPNIHLKGSPFYVNTRLKSWDVEAGIKRCAAISSFGFSGTNVHMVIEEAPVTEIHHPEKPGYLIVLSARTSEQLRRQVKQLTEYCEKNPRIDCGNISYTLFLGRKHFQHRLACVVRSREELVTLFRKWLVKGKVSQIYVSELHENDHRQQPSLKRYGNQCVQNCRDTSLTEDYLENLNTIADLYIQGYALEFGQLFQGNRYLRISLPTYPFARERYWVPEARNDASLPGLGKRQSLLCPIESKEKNPCSELMYLPVWEVQTVSAPLKSDSYRTVLIVYCESSISFEKSILDYYLPEESTQTVIQVRLSHQTKQVSENEWRCDRNDLQGFETCLQGYDSIDGLYFISLCHGEKQPMDFNALADSQQNNEIQLLRLIKWFQQSDTIHNPLDCTIITQDNYRIKDTHINPYGGGITGLTYAIAQGDHRFSVRNIDISAEDLVDPGKRDALFRHILNEACDDRGAVVKFKGGRRYKQVFTRLEGERLKKESGLKKGGVYVILGGSGTVGSIITRYLIKKYDARIVWIGRKPETSPVIQGKMESLVAGGVTPLYIQADVTRLEQMQGAVAEIKDRYPIINGAIFSGLLIDFENTIHKTDEREFLDILNVKTTGSLNFYTALQDEPLDFMCFFSSAQAFSFSGAANLFAYAAGITFSDAFVRCIRGTSAFPVGTINWGFWKPSGADQHLSKHVGALEDREGFDCFEYFTRLLTDGELGQVICLRASQPVKELMNPKTDEVTSIVEKHTDSIATAEPSFGDLESYVNNFVIERLSESLEVSATRIDSHVAFSDYGVDSIIGVSFVKKINNGLGVSLNSAILFDYATVDRLTDYVVKTFKEQIQAQMDLSFNTAPPRNQVESGDDIFASGLRPADDTDAEWIKDLENRFLANEISTEALMAALDE